MKQGLCSEISFQRKLRRMLAAAAITAPMALAPEISSAQDLLELLFGGSKQRPTSFFDSIFKANTQPPSPAPERQVSASSGPAFCVRSCDGKYFPLVRSAASPARTCEAFCPASPTQVYFGSSIENAYTKSGERYADSENAFVYRRDLRADCTCNGHSPAGLAAVDLVLDDSLRPGDVVATGDGLVAYSGMRVGVEQTREFSPVASFPGLTQATRARLNAMAVTPARTDMTANNDVTRAPLPPPTAARNAAPQRDKRVTVDAD